MADTKVLHTFNDGSRLVRYSVQQLISLPVWKGNRILDRDHVDNIKNAMLANNTPVSELDSGYRIIVIREEGMGGKIVEEKYIIDGQHRRAVLIEMLNLCQDFQVVATEKRVNSETEAIEYFNRINTVKPIQLDEDPRMIINRYMSALMKAMDSRGKLFRSMRTTRPFMDCEDLRKALDPYVNSLKKIPVDQFVKKVKEINERLLREIEIELALGSQHRVKDKGIKESAIAKKFALAVDKKMKWINDAV